MNYFDSFQPIDPISSISESNIKAFCGATSINRGIPDDGRKNQPYPRILWVGIGCMRGTSKEVIDKAIKNIFQRHHLNLQSIAGLATLDIKANEQGLLEYCQEKNLPLKTFTTAELKQIDVPNPSNIALSQVETPSVSEASALKMGETLLIPKQIELGSVTIAVSLTPKQETIDKSEI